MYILSPPVESSSCHIIMLLALVVDRATLCSRARPALLQPNRRLPYKKFQLVKTHTMLGQQRVAALGARK
jgi:hypothetical protein